jgi:hypothetical protein
MSIQRDYILRIVEALAQAVARIVALRKAGQTKEALAEVERTAGSLLGVDLRLLEAIGPGPIAAQLRHPEQVEALARLVDERVSLEREGGDAAAADRWAARAAGLRAAAAGRAPTA